MGERVTRAAVQRIAEGLSQRDRAILADVARVRVLTSRQVERLHFAELQGAYRDRNRRRVLERLASLQLLAPLQRRIGGVRAGSAGLVFALGLAGQRLFRLEANGNLGGRARRPHIPTDRFLGHSLAVAELYVGLVEADRAGSLTLVGFEAEPDCWWRDSEGEWVKPDAYAVVSAGEVQDSWAVEVDMGTESVPTLRRKLAAYLGLVEQGEHGPDGGVLPRVLVTVPDEHRRTVLRGVVSGLPPPASELISVVLQGEASRHLVEVLRE